MGAMSEWPCSLQALARFMLDSPEPMAIWWGADALQLYNDAYAPRLENNGRVRSLGQPAAEHWKDGWAAVADNFKSVMAGGVSTRQTDVLVGIDRNGRVEDSYWTYSFTPLRDDAGLICGVLVISTETTAQVLGSRRQATLD